MKDTYIIVISVLIALALFTLSLITFFESNNGHTYTLFIDGKTSFIIKDL